MFTGLIQAQGKLKSIYRQIHELKLTCQAPDSFLETVKIGDSIAVDGVCLTVTDIDATTFMAEMMPETFQRSHFKNARTGQAVNLERALRVDQRFEGHFVQGHVDTVVRLRQKKRQQHALVLTFELPQAYCRQVVSKGSVALNGTSLTVINATTHDFEVGLIPHSQATTNLRTLEVGAQVNLETDILGKYLIRQIELNA